MDPETAVQQADERSEPLAAAAIVLDPSLFPA
jgi:hypothetical protein